MPKEFEVSITHFSYSIIYLFIVYLFVWKRNTLVFINNSYVMYNMDQGVYLQSILYLHRANIFVSCKFVNVVWRIFVSSTVP